MKRLTSQISSNDHLIRLHEIDKNPQEPKLHPEDDLKYYHVNEQPQHLPDKDGLELAAAIFQAETLLKSSANIHQELDNIKEKIHYDEEQLYKTKRERLLSNTKCKDYLQQIEEMLLPLDESCLRKLIANIEEFANSLEIKQYDIIKAIYKRLSVLLKIYQTDDLPEDIRTEIANTLKPINHKHITSKHIGKYLSSQKPNIEVLCNTIDRYRAYSLYLSRKIELYTKNIQEQSKMCLCLESVMLINSMEAKITAIEHELKKLHEELSSIKQYHHIETEKKIADIELYKKTIAETKIKIVKNNTIINEELERLSYQESELLTKKQEMMKALDSGTKKKALEELFSFKPGQKINRSTKIIPPDNATQLSPQQKINYRLEITEINKVLEKMSQEREILQKNIINPDEDNTSERQMRLLFEEQDTLRDKSLSHSEEITTNTVKLSNEKSDLLQSIAKCKLQSQDMLRKLLVQQDKKYDESSAIIIGTDFIKHYSEKDYLLEFYTVFKEVASIHNNLKSLVIEYFELLHLKQACQKKLEEGITIEISVFKTNEVIEKWKIKYHTFSKYAIQALDILKKIQFVEAAKKVLSHQNNDNFTILYSIFDIEMLEKWYSIMFQLSAHDLMHQMIELSIIDTGIESLYILWQQQIEQDEKKIRKADQNFNLVANEIANKYSSMIDIIIGKTESLTHKINLQKNLRTSLKPYELKTIKNLQK